MARPGVMIYFNLIPVLDMLTDAQIGRLFKAIMKFGKKGTVPRFRDKELDMIWPITQQRLEYDDMRYNRAIVLDLYRKYKNDTASPLPFEKWRQMHPDAVAPYEKEYTYVNVYYEDADDPDANECE